MKKFLLLASALVSFSAFADEKCEIKISAKDSKWFSTQYDAEKHCDAYKVLACKVYNPESGKWNSVINFSDVFKGADGDFNTARRDAYRQYFNAIEGRGLYKMPFSFSLAFDCKSKY